MKAVTERGAHTQQKAAGSCVKSQRGLTALKELFIPLNALDRER